ncbi:hypothetical protein BS50DRAFT_144528 [Corynespora cassiicola Philippines]|uniref:Uncharacterized protein n=1 Tax=Corynespora cassiicola Philippines TaxID=1448308 RepID=A0A2T2N8C3_CORCC|nr:hypothetical protein BS50DRAFT_144528 [Corynespora cassiicola Philippines]
MALLQITGVGEGPAAHTRPCVCPYRSLPAELLVVWTQTSRHPAADLTMARLRIPAAYLSPLRGYPPSIALRRRPLAFITRACPTTAAPRSKKALDNVFSGLASSGAPWRQFCLGGPSSTPTNGAAAPPIHYRTLYPQTGRLTSCGNPACGVLVQSREAKPSATLRETRTAEAPICLSTRPYGMSAERGAPRGRASAPFEEVLECVKGVECVECVNSVGEPSPHPPPVRAGMREEGPLRTAA